MSFLRRERRDIVALVDIGARSVAGAFVQYAPGELPTIVYSRHLPIEIQTVEEHSDAMLRALEMLCNTLVNEGIPALVRAVSKHVIDSVIVSIDAPWQETIVHEEKVLRANDFTFTKALVAEVVAKVSPPAAGSIYTDASVVGTILNGYDVQEPYGKRTQDATVIILTSRIKEDVADAIRSTLQSLVRTKHTALIAGTSLRYQALRALFPHEHNALILDATGSLPEVALVRHGLLVAASETPESLVSARGITADDFMRGFAKLAKTHPLPRTLFLLARFDEMETMKKTLDAVNFSTLWLSDNPPRIIELLPTHLTGLVRQTTTTPPDLPLLLMAIYGRYLEQKI